MSPRKCQIYIVLNRNNESAYITFGVVGAVLICLVCIYRCAGERVKKNVLGELKIRGCKNIICFTDGVFN